MPPTHQVTMPPIVREGDVLLHPSYPRFYLIHNALLKLFTVRGRDIIDLLLLYNLLIVWATFEC